MKKHKRFKGLFLCLIICMVFTFIGCRGRAAVSNIEVSMTEAVADIKTSKFSMHFIDVGQGDATLIGCDGEWMLIDAGDNTKGSAVQLYLKKAGVLKLKYVIGTHPDADHIGGMDVIITKFDCENILLPDKKSDSKEYEELIDAVNYRNYKISVPKVGEKFTLGSADFTVLGPISKAESNNNNSIVVKVKYKDTLFLLSGDAESEEEQEIVDSGADLKADVYHAGHHGSNTSSSSEWLNKISPEYVVISCGKGNTYGHPHREVLDEFKKLGAKVYRTDEQGSIVVSSDGVKLSWNVKPSDTWKSGYENSGTGDVVKNKADTVPQKNMAEDKTTDPGNSLEMTYILNNNSLKFHYPDCKSVPKIKDKNKEEVKTTRDELIKRGYEPCKICNP